MNLPYAYSPYLLPMLASAAFIAILAVYAWHRRSVPGAVSYSVLMLFSAVGALGVALGLAAIDQATKIFWFKFPC